ncbi:hypothetical protein [Pseudokineococcus sp. 1T1Z-3]|uniref:hypothetical protein n=1 Tax=Pseudokineococcus sp. 1T1Z-3 TaxID=3132745 RepID=UPI0030A6C9D4
MDELRDVVRGDELWSGDGRRWERGRPRWLDARAVSRWVRRGDVVACLGPDGDAVTWWSADEAAAWWSAVSGAFQVPGGSAATAADAAGRTYGACLWRSRDQRRLGVQVFC